MKDDSVLFNSNSKLPQLYNLGRYLFIVSACLFFIGMFTISDYYFKGRGIWSYSSGVDMRIIGLYLIFCSMSINQSIESIIGLGSNPVNFFTDKNIGGGVYIYKIEKRLPKTIFYISASIFTLFSIDESSQLYFSWLVIVIIIINVVCFSIVEYYKKIIEAQKEETKE